MVGLSRDRPNPVIWGNWTIFFLLIFSEVRGVRLGGARLLIWARQRREKEEIHSAAREGILTDKDDVTAGRNRKGKTRKGKTRKGRTRKGRTRKGRTTKDTTKGRTKQITRRNK